MERYLSLINKGWIPVWTGEDFLKDDTTKSRFKDDDTDRDDLKDDDDSVPDTVTIMVKLARGTTRMMYRLPIPIPDTKNYKVLTKNTAMNPGSNVGILPNMTGSRSSTRVASILGYTCLSYPGTARNELMTYPKDMDVMGLDVEQSIYYRSGGFPLATDPLISIAIVSSKVGKLCGYTCGYIDEDEIRKNDVTAIRFKNSQELADWAITTVIDNCPDFLVIHNGFGYDVARLAAHCSEIYRSYFVAVNLGAKAKGMEMVIPGVTLIDTYFYLSKLHNGRYPSLSLASIAATFNLEAKHDSPTMMVDVLNDDNNMTKMLLYNVHDAYLHIKISECTGCIEEMMSIACLTHSSLSEVNKFLSGTLASLMASSYALHEKCVIDWSEDSTLFSTFRGGFVRQPKRGFHKNVTVFDFGSLYPSIMRSANISHETVYVISDGNQRAAIMRACGLTEHNRYEEDNIQVRWTISSIYVLLDNILAVIDRQTIGIATKSLEEILRIRASLGANKNSPKGWGCKIAANSYYGALGSTDSGLSSRLAAALVTALGRYLTKFLMRNVEILGYDIIYGDTDSIFVKSVDGSPIDENILLKKYSEAIEGTIYSLIKLEFELRYESLILSGRKMYYGTYMKNGKIAQMAKGLAIVRRDRPGICRLVARNICNLICLVGPKLACKPVARLLYEVKIAIHKETIPSTMCMYETKVQANVVWAYVNKNGNKVFVDKKIDMSKYEDYPSKQWVIDYLDRSTKKILTVSGLPSFKLLINNHLATVEDIISPEHDDCYVHDFPLYGPLCTDLSEEDNMVIEIFLKGGKCAYIGTTPYIYVAREGSWSHLYSSESARQIVEAIGMKNVSVNFDIAAEPYQALIKKYARLANEIPRSICLSSLRLYPEVIDSKIRFSFVSDVIRHSSVVGSFCHIPVMMDIIPKQIDISEPSEVLEWIGNSLDDVSLRTLKWVVGNALLDPVQRPRLLYILGDGFSGVTVSLSKDYLGDKSLSMTKEDVKLALTHRIITCSELILKDKGEFNTKFIRTINGGDNIQIGNLSGDREIWQVWYTRRVIALVTKRLSFIGHCFSPYFTRGVILDDNASPDEAGVATMVISIQSGIKYNDLIALASAMSSLLIVKTKLFSAIVGIKPDIPNV
ncbi:DNA-directed DNA polymerase delta [Rhizoclosmatium hyalinum]|nr:DNA-directed DNA polymerase delta [Rhizoclosmatium hyalinum]